MISIAVLAGVAQGLQRSKLYFKWQQMWKILLEAIAEGGWSSTSPQDINLILTGAQSGAGVASATHRVLVMCLVWAGLNLLVRSLSWVTDDEILTISLLDLCTLRDIRSSSRSTRSQIFARKPQIN